MKTLFVWNDFESPAKFFFLAGDHSKLNGVYINSMDNAHLQDELNDLVYDPDGNVKVKMKDNFPLDEVYQLIVQSVAMMQKQVVVANCGFSL